MNLAKIKNNYQVDAVEDVECHEPWERSMEKQGEERIAKLEKLL